ncbi:type II secretion system minor pseudopilin GspI [Brevundimonas sp.]|jgi:general secretion pathway protein I|uniref:type II secretion system minor pseudopilin GspI n=1 Tax=Brevundimonas sp. TaxID=1871086 RepID=UPI0037C0761A
MVDRTQAARPCRARSSAHERPGFTLIEMLVALAVFSLAAMALLNLSGESTRSAVRVEARTLGGVVAENIAAEAMIAPSLPVGQVEGETRMANRVWRWRRVVSGAEAPGVGRIDVRVFTDEGQVADRVLFRAAGA